MASRRIFIGNAGKFIASAAVLPLMAAGKVTNSDKLSSEFLFKLGIAGYSFEQFTIDQSLDMMKRTDVHFLCIKDFHLPYDSTDVQIAVFLEKLKQAGVTGYAVGPIDSNEIGIDQCFDYARRLGVNLIVGIPNIEDLPNIDRKVKEFNIRYVIHNHGPEEKRYPNAISVYNLVKNLDCRIGLCFDIGHNMRYGNDPVQDMKKYACRIFDIHIKNVTEATKRGKACELGRGIIDIPAFLKMLHRVNYNGCCSLEYEKDMEAPLPGIAESLGYFRGICDTIKEG